MADDLVKRLRKHVFYGDARLFNMKKHSPLAMEAAHTIEAQAAEIERLQVEAKAQFDRGYYEGCANPIVRHDALRDALAAVLYRKSAEFQVGLTVADSYTLAAEAIAFLQEQSK